MNYETLFNKKISNYAKIIYMQLQYYSTLENVKVTERMLLEYSNMSDYRFAKTINELLDLGLIKCNQTIAVGKLIYEYSLSE